MSSHNGKAAMKHKKALTALIMLGVLGVQQIAHAQYGKAVDVIRDIQIEGLSLKSTAKDIEAFISAHPSLQCQRIDNPERKSKYPNRPPTPRWQSWKCFYTHKTRSQVLQIHMSGGVIVHLDYQTGYEDPADFEKMVSYVRSLNKKFEALQLPHGQADPVNNMTYEDRDIVGASSPTFTQQLRVRVSPQCDGAPINFNVSVGSNKIPSQNVYRTGVKIERSRHPLHCTNIQ